MTDFLQLAVLGVGAGAALSLLSQGIVLIYRGSGVLNLAHGAIAMLAAHIYIALSDAGWASWQAAVITIALSSLMGAVIHNAVLRPMGEASILVKSIAMIAVLLITQAGVTLIFGTDATFVQSFLPQAVTRVGGISVPQDRIVLALIALLLTGLLYAVFRWSTIGLAISATAENSEAAAALGWSPHVIGTVAWASGSGLAGLAGILVGPFTGVDPQTLTLIVIGGLAGALIGGLSSFPLAALGGFGIGIAQAVIPSYVELQGAAQTVPLVIIIGLLVWRGSKLPARDHVGVKFPSLGDGRISGYGVAGFAAIGAAALLLLPIPWVDALRVTLVWSIFLLSVVVLTGYAGQLCLAQFALGGVGALTTSWLISSKGWPLEAAAVTGVAAATAAGLLFALPALRTRGIELAIVTLSLSAVLHAMVFNSAEFTGGVSGMDVSQRSLFGIGIDSFDHPRRFAIVVLVAFVVTALLVANLRRSKPGLSMITIRTRERAAASLGVSVAVTKLTAFAVGSAIAGLAGVLLILGNPVALFSQFDPIGSLMTVTLAVIGGVGYIVGAPLGGQLSTGGVGTRLGDSFGLGNLNQWLVLFTGVFLILLLIQDPNGMARPTILQVKAVKRAVLRMFGRQPAPGRRGREVVVDTALDAAEAGPRRRLEVQDLTVRFGGVTALAGVSLSVEPGEVVGVIGPNGAGKTTLIDAITGFVDPTGGVVRLGVDDVTSWPAHRRARGGLSRSFQSLELLDDISVADNFRVGGPGRDTRSLVRSLLLHRFEPLPASAIGAIRQFDLERDLDELPANLAYGRRRLTAVARSVATSPAVLLLDEPAAGLSDVESAELAQLVRQLADELRIAVLLVEHNVALVRECCDRIVVLDFGRVIAAGDPSIVSTDPAVVAAYSGRASTPERDERPAPSVVPGP
ncbi:branched-chain amino acid ABC transporter permease/ATP-binding protein [Parafrankia sp. EUN1f]|uniref:branched-chain amino acid ABC transporter permease/ATP-binding protein n=1 Tax=Parafrankia sp. EUN1f TaxID=102897 RepID=UPI0001C46FCC|nr:branched-chain amino acid ABC transporter permease/ATP-binding protein [Parafrankia sp. EUN1f]EFC86767.1 ABC transporter related protein [Parafrankia sp. EUN1f]